ncbi:hypothetical protein [Rhodomicrobium udaipurense]|uniref:Shikimate dehydrogenase n=1 Tax=Rhodomicrobium udaipurense TaxID=1202716 RepID=A0A8I1GES0_9HYPH|nr:hypothetical protein [Rhodomicrobium udaipurense]MBJ7543619.1 hypothetical protein [Rhodomicrobium udaipurense]
MSSDFWSRSLARIARLIAPRTIRVRRKPGVPSPSPSARVPRPRLGSPSRFPTMGRMDSDWEGEYDNATGCRNTVYTAPQTVVAPQWANVTLGVLGTQRLDRAIARNAATAGAKVAILGAPLQPKLRTVAAYPDPASVVKGARYAILPVFAPAQSAQASASFAPERAYGSALGGMSAGAHLIAPRADAALTRHAAALGLTVHSYEDGLRPILDAASEAMDELFQRVEKAGTQLQGSTVCVIAGERIPDLLIVRLSVSGARVHLATNERGLDDAFPGVTVLPLSDLPVKSPKFDAIFSTINGPVVDARELGSLPDHALVVDLADPPGSVDFQLAKQLGRKAIWARGIMRRVPPLGQAYWSVIGGLIASLEQNES